jgi:hypothetical protein
MFSSCALTDPGSYIETIKELDALDTTKSMIYKENGGPRGVFRGRIVTVSGGIVADIPYIS